MFKEAVPFFIHTISPLHAGSGSDLGIVDLPIQRERHTSFPRIEGASLKGAMREVFSEKAEATEKTNVKIEDKNVEINDKTISLTFGPESDNGEEGAGALGFADARILFFPVKSVKGVFAWITCPKVLRQFETDMNIKKEEKDRCYITVPNVSEGKCIAPSGLTVGGKIILEEYAFELENYDTNTLMTEINKFYEINELAKKLVILSDDDFKDFVNLSTEVATRIRIDPETGTVAKGALFTEEYLPAETVLYSMALAHDVFKESNDIKTAENVIDFFKEGHSEYMQIGGNTTIGKGIVRIRIRIGQDKQDKQDLG